MDSYKELIERLKIDAEWAEGQEWETPLCLWDDLMDAVYAIATLTEENARLRAKLKSAQESHAFWMEEEMGVQRQLRAELEQVTAQRDAYKGTLDSANQTNAAMAAKLKRVKREWDTAAEILEGWKTKSRPTRTLA